MTAPPILPSSLAVGDEVEFTHTVAGRCDGYVDDVRKGAACVVVEANEFVATLRDVDAARLAIRIVRRGTT